MCPPTRRSEWRPIIIPTCESCNNGSSDDDAHFRTVVVIAGKANADATELWDGPIRRALREVDGRRRVKDVYELMSPATDAGEGQYRIFPANDERVLRVVRKITRGLCFHHQLPTPVEGDIFSDILRLPPPEGTINSMTSVVALPGVFSYAYGILDDERSVWILEFFDRTAFVSLIGDWKGTGVEEPGRN